MGLWVCGMKNRLIPVLLGLDLGAYAVALSFYETYGVTSHAFGRYPCGITRYSSIVRTHIVPDLLEEGGVAALLSFSARYPDADLFLVPCGDWYLRFAQRHRDALSTAYRMYLPEKTLTDRISDKAEFLHLLDAAGLPHPETRVLSYMRDAPLFAHDPTVGFPAVLKAADSTEYYAHPFPGMKKVDFPTTPKEAETLLKRIYASGYRGKVLWQKYVDADRAETLTLFLDNRSRVRVSVRARVVLEERAPGARGNYAALITLPPDGLCRTLGDFAAGLGYTGFCNFDILYRGDQPYVLEMNPRQGRSCDYLRAAGVSLAACLLTAAGGGVLPVKQNYPRILWRCVSARTVRRYGARDCRGEVERLEREGFSISPFDRRNEHTLLHRAYVGIHLFRRDSAVAKFAAQPL